MPDGPDIHKLFTETTCLTATSNLDDICRYLRFYKNEGSYQQFLAKFLPLLAKPEYKTQFDEFIGDLEDKKMAKELKKGFDPPEPTQEELDAIAKAEADKKAAAKEAKAQEKADKKAAKDAKNS